MAFRFRLNELADVCGAQILGSPSIIITSIATITDAKPGSISFLSNETYAQYLETCQASAVIVSHKHSLPRNYALLVVNDPYLAYAKIAGKFSSSLVTEHPFIHPSAVIDPSVSLGKNVSVGPNCVLAEGVIVEDGCTIGANSIIGSGVRIGKSSHLIQSVNLCHDVIIGERVILHPGVVVGADGFGLADDQGVWLKIPQLGSVRMGNDCEIGANTTIDRGAIDDTILEEDVRLDNQVQIGHNVFIGKHTAVAGCTAIAGSARIGKHCLIAGGVGICGHLEICDGVTITAMSLVTHSITHAGDYSSGSPLQESKKWRKNTVRLRHLDKMYRKLSKIDQKIRQLLS